MRFVVNRRRALKVLALATLAGLVMWFYATGRVEEIDPNEFRTWIRDAGPWGGVLFVAVYSVVQPLGAPSTFFLLAAPLIWAPAVAFSLSWAGAMGASLLCYGFARFVGRDWVQQRLPTRVRRLDERLAERGFVTVLFLRLAFYTNPTVQYGLGVSRVKVAPFLLGTVVGMMPYTLLMTFVGVRFNDWIEVHPPSTWPWARIWPAAVLGVVLLVALIFMLAVRHRRHR